MSASVASEGRTDKLRRTLIVVSGLAVAGRLVVASELLWRAGLPRVGARSGHEIWRSGLSGSARWPCWGPLRSPTRGKPASHEKPARHDSPARHTGVQPLAGCRNDQLLESRSPRANFQVR